VISSGERMSLSPNIIVIILRNLKISAATLVCVLFFNWDQTTEMVIVQFN